MDTLSLTLNIGEAEIEQLRQLATLRNVSSSRLVADIVKEALRAQRIRDAAMTFETNNRHRRR